MEKTLYIRAFLLDLLVFGNTLATIWFRKGIDYVIDTVIQARIYMSVRPIKLVNRVTKTFGNGNIRYACSNQK